MTVHVATAMVAEDESAFVVELSTVPGTELVRRCADVEELRALAYAGLLDTAALSPAFAGVDGSLLSDLRAAGVVPLLVVRSGEDIDARRRGLWDVRHHHVLGSGDLERSLQETVEAALPAQVGDEEVGEDPSGQGQVVAVWGPHGAPGRTTVATQLARELALDGPTLLIDADTCAPAVDIFFGLVVHSSGILAAARLVDAGTLDPHGLAALTVRVELDLDVLSGIGSAVRWRELDAHHLEKILAVAKRAYRWIVVDVAPEIEPEVRWGQELGPTRHGVTRPVLVAAQDVLALAAADVVGVQRFLTAFPDLQECTPSIRVVVTKSRSSTGSGARGQEVTTVLERFCGTRAQGWLPSTVAGTDRAILHARPDAALAGDSAYAQAFDEVVRLVRGADAPPLRRSTRRRRSGAALWAAVRGGP